MQEKKQSRIPVRFIKGVGPKMSLLFGKLGVDSVEDLFYYLPRRYEDRTNLVKISRVKPGEEQAVVGTVTRTGCFSAKTGTNIFEITLDDGSGSVSAVWYNMPYMSNVFSKGQKVLIYGRVELFNRLQFTHPVYEIIDEASDKASLEVGRIVPVYPLIKELSQRYMHKCVMNAIQSFIGEMPETLPTNIRARHKLADIKFALENIHFPSTFEALNMAYRRLVFEEFFTLQVIMALRRRKHARQGIAHRLKEGMLDDFEELFSFRFTDDQKRCIREIEKDMASQKPMYRLLQGDVGSGKTVVAMYAMFLAVNNGYQAAMMAPTEILARQHFVTVSQAMMPLGLDIRLLVGGIDKNSRSKMLDGIRGGGADIVIGTHALFQEDVAYKNLGLIVIDEQHKFGVGQRKALKAKAPAADTLVMTATPIPRSLALTIYGDMDVSVIKEKPSGRSSVSTWWADEGQRPLVNSFLREEIARGRQAFIVCPRIKGTDGAGSSSAESLYKNLKSGPFKDLRVAMLHGRMDMDKKDPVMKDFRDKKFDILVSTTVVEVGVDIPNATVMVVENADQFGLAQLHQLRGRIGRGKEESYCILMAGASSENANERLSAISGTDDGFKIAEKDLELRGPGEFLGKRQSGIPELKFGDISKDFRIMEEAREAAVKLVEDDPLLGDERHFLIRQRIAERFGK